MKLVNCINSEEPDIGLLKGYKVSILLKENNHLIYFEFWKIPIYILPFGSDETKENGRPNIFKRVSQDGSSWTLPIIAIRKPNEDLRICRDYKV